MGAGGWKVPVGKGDGEVEDRAGEAWMDKVGAVGNLRDASLVMDGLRLGNGAMGFAEVASGAMTVELEVRHTAATRTVRRDVEIDKRDTGAMCRDEKQGRNAAVAG